jgi:hypothetical protein
VALQPPPPTASAVQAARWRGCPKWRARAANPTRHEVRRAALKRRVKELFEASGGAYGSPRITQDLRAEGWQASANTVAEIMTENGWYGRAPRKHRNLTRRQGSTLWLCADWSCPLARPGRRTDAAVANRRLALVGAAVVAVVCARRPDRHARTRRQQTLSNGREQWPPTTPGCSG